MKIEVCKKEAYLWVILEQALVLYEMSWSLAEKELYFASGGALKGGFSLSSKKELVYQPGQEEAAKKDLPSSAGKGDPRKRARRDEAVAINTEDEELLLFLEEGFSGKGTKSYPPIYADHVELTSKEQVLVVENRIIWVFSMEKGKTYLNVDMRKRLHARVISALLVN